MWEAFLRNKKKIVAAIVGLAALIAATFFNINISDSTQQVITDSVTEILPDAPSTPAVSVPSE